MQAAWCRPVAQARDGRAHRGSERAGGVVGALPDAGEDDLARGPGRLLRDLAKSSARAIGALARRTRTGPGRSARRGAWRRLGLPRRGVNAQQGHLDQARVNVAVLDLLVDAPQVRLGRSSGSTVGSNSARAAAGPAAPRGTSAAGTAAGEPRSRARSASRWNSIELLAALRRRLAGARDLGPHLARRRSGRPRPAPPPRPGRAPARPPRRLPARAGGGARRLAPAATGQPSASAQPERPPPPPSPSTASILSEAPCYRRRAHEPEIPVAAHAASPPPCWSGAAMRASW